MKDNVSINALWNQALVLYSLGMAITKLDHFFNLIRIYGSDGTLKLISFDIENEQDSLLLQVVEWTKGEKSLRLHAYTQFPLLEELEKRKIQAKNLGLTN